MKEKPDIEKVKQVAPEAENLEEIGSGGYKVVYKALVSGKVLQSWEALKSLNEELADKDVASGLEKCLQAVSRAEQAYGEIASFGIVLDQKSRDEHILPLLEGLRQFRERAEL